MVSVCQRVDNSELPGQRVQDSDTCGFWIVSIATIANASVFVLVVAVWCHRLWCRMTSQKSKNETLVLLESPLPLRAIPNCQMDGSPPAPPLALPPSVAEPAPPLSSPSPRWPGDRPRGDSPLKSKLYWIIQKRAQKSKEMMKLNVGKHNLTLHCHDRRFCLFVCLF